MDLPEHEKLRPIRAKSQAIGEFLEWLKDRGFVLAEWGPHDRLWPASIATQDLLARYFDIDLTKLEAEKRAIIEGCRNAGG